MTNLEPRPEPPRRGFRTGRLEAFSDGVFAIAITLLVLDIAVSATAGKHLLRSVADLWPSYLAYVASFSTIGAAWLGHNAIIFTHPTAAEGLTFLLIGPPASG